MFLKGLTDIQQKLFLGVARQLIEADSKISDRERDMINALSEEMGQQELIPNPPDDVLKAFFPDKRSRTAIMLELIGLSACDGDFAVEEDRIITRLKGVLEVSDADLKAYKGWVKKLFDLYAEAAGFLSGRPASTRAGSRPRATGKGKAAGAGEGKPRK